MGAFYCNFTKASLTGELPRGVGVIPFQTCRRHSERKDTQRSLCAERLRDDVGEW